MADDPIEWEEKGAFVMPVLTATLKVDPVLAALLHATAFLELSGDDTVDPDWAVEAMEYVAHYLQQLSAEQVEVIRVQVERVTDHARKQKWSAEAVEFFAGFLENFGIGEERE